MVCRVRADGLGSRSSGRGRLPDSRRVPAAGNRRSGFWVRGGIRNNWRSFGRNHHDALLRGNFPLGAALDEFRASAPRPASANTQINPSRLVAKFLGGNVRSSLLLISFPQKTPSRVIPELREKP